MLSIDLTEDHRNKILEMCKILFPDYDIGFGFMEGWGYDYDEYGDALILIKKDSETK